MALDDRERQEIKALVAEEIHQVLRREMAHWWAESILALAGYPPPSDRGSDTQGTAGPGSDGNAGQKTPPRAKTVRPRPVGRPRPPVPLLANHGAPNHAGTGSHAGDGSTGTPTGDPDGVDYLTGVVESLLRTQESLAQQLQASMRHLETLLSERGGQPNGQQEK